MGRHTGMGNLSCPDIALETDTSLFLSSTAASTAPLDLSQQSLAMAGTLADVRYLLQAAEGSLGVCDG